MLTATDFIYCIDSKAPYTTHPAPKSAALFLPLLGFPRSDFAHIYFSYVLHQLQSILHYNWPSSSTGPLTWRFFSVMNTKYHVTRARWIWGWGTMGTEEPQVPEGPTTSYSPQPTPPTCVIQVSTVSTPSLTSSKLGQCPPHPCLIFKSLV